VSDPGLQQALAVCTGLQDASTIAASPVVSFGQVCEQAVSHHGIASGNIVPGLCVEVEIVPVPAGAAKEQTPASC
jgi:hypothetical protein